MAKMVTKRIKMHNCPFCGRPNDAVTGTTGAHMPSEGDLSLCMGCGEPSFFCEDLSLRKPTDDEYMEIAANQDVRRAREAWLRVMEAERGKASEH